MLQDEWAAIGEQVKALHERLCCLKPKMAQALNVPRVAITVEVSDEATRGPGSMAFRMVVLGPGSDYDAICPAWGETPEAMGRHYARCVAERCRDATGIDAFEMGDKLDGIGYTTHHGDH
jgi:hypothetical protein